MHAWRPQSYESSYFKNYVLLHKSEFHTSGHWNNESKNLRFIHHMYFGRFTIICYFNAPLTFTGRAYQPSLLCLLACQHISCVHFVCQHKGCSFLSSPWEILRGGWMEVRNQNLKTSSRLRAFTTGSPAKNSMRSGFARTQLSGWGELGFSTSTASSTWSTPCFSL